MVRVANIYRASQKLKPKSSKRKLLFLIAGILLVGIFCLGNVYDDYDINLESTNEKFNSYANDYEQDSGFLGGSSSSTSTQVYENLEEKDPDEYVNVNGNVPGSTDEHNGDSAGDVSAVNEASSEGAKVAPEEAAELGSEAKEEEVKDPNLYVTTEEKKDTAKEDEGDEVVEGAKNNMDAGYYDKMKKFQAATGLPPSVNGTVTVTDTITPTPVAEEGSSSNPSVNNTETVEKDEEKTESSVVDTEDSANVTTTEGTEDVNATIIDEKEESPSTVVEVNASNATTDANTNATDVTADAGEKGDVDTETSEAEDVSISNTTNTNTTDADAASDKTDAESGGDAGSETTAEDDKKTSSAGEDTSEAANVDVGAGKDEGEKSANDESSETETEEGGDVVVSPAEEDVSSGENATETGSEKKTESSEVAEDNTAPSSESVEKVPVDEASENVETSGEEGEGAVTTDKADDATNESDGANEEKKEDNSVNTEADDKDGNKPLPADYFDDDKTNPRSDGDDDGAGGEGEGEGDDDDANGAESKRKEIELIAVHLELCKSNPFAPSLDASLEDIDNASKKWLDAKTENAITEDGVTREERAKDVLVDESERRYLRERAGRRTETEDEETGDSNQQEVLSGSPFAAKCLVESPMLPGMCDGIAHAVGKDGSKKGGCEYYVAFAGTLPDDLASMPIHIKLVKETTCKINVVSLCQEDVDVKLSTQALVGDRELEESEKERLIVHEGVCIASGSTIKQSSEEDNENSIVAKPKPPAVDLLYIEMTGSSGSPASFLKSIEGERLRLVSQDEGVEENEVYLPMQMVFYGIEENDVKLQDELQMSLLSKGYVVLSNEDNKSFSLMRFLCPKPPSAIGGSASFMSAGFPM